MKQYEAMFLFDPNFGASFENCEKEVRRLMDRAEAELLFCRTWDERRLAYRIKGRKYRPDLLIIGFALNDAIDESTVMGFLESLREQQEEQWIRKSKLASWILERLPTDRADVASGFAVSFEHKPTWRRLSRSFDGFARDARRDGIPVVLVLFPLLLDLERYEYQRIHVQVTREARRHGFVVLDLLETFREQGAERVRLVRSDIWHPGPEGHRIAAETLHTLLTSDVIGDGAGATPE